MTMRVKPVIISSTAGKNDRAVKNISVWTGTEKLILEPPVPTSNGNCPAVCATTEPCSANAVTAKIALPHKTDRFKPHLSFRSNQLDSHRCHWLQWQAAQHNRHLSDCSRQRSAGK